MLGDVPIGRLVCGLADQAPDSRAHGFELLLPPRVGAALTAAHVIDQALERHRDLRALETTSGQPATFSL